jgi:hypothetical protein
MSATETIPERRYVANASNMVHEQCQRCYPEIAPGQSALCGATLRGVERWGDPTDCVMCAATATCPRCGMVQLRRAGDH